MSSVGWLDWTLLAVLAASVLIGMVRGFVFEMMALAGWVVAWFAAQWAAPEVAPRLPIGSPGSALNMAAAFAGCFLGTLLLWALVSRLVRMLVHATPLSAADRALGAGFGLVRAAVLLLALATVVTLTPAANSSEWRGSAGASWLMIGLRGLKPLLPPAMAEKLPA